LCVQGEVISENLREVEEEKKAKKTHMVGSRSPWGAKGHLLRGKMFAARVSDRSMKGGKGDLQHPCQGKKKKKSSSGCG